MKKWWQQFARKSRAQRGQMLIIFSLIIVPVSLVIGVVAVDVTLWQSERRGAQKDADLAALAGAYTLLDPAATAGQARADAQNYADTNDEADNASIIGTIGVDSECFGSTSGRLNRVTVNVDHDANTFFSGIFGALEPEVGAHAVACAGSVISATGLRPYGIESAPDCSGAWNFSTNADLYVSSRPVQQPPTRTPSPTKTPKKGTDTPTPTYTPTNTPAPTNTPGGPTATPTTGTGSCRPSVDSDCFEANADGIFVPKFGSWCQLDDGSLDPSTSTRGLLDLGLTGDVCSDGGNDNIDENVQDGSGATCRIGDAVERTAGARPGQDINMGIDVLLDGDGTPPVADGADCDKRSWGDGDDTDDFDEVLERIDGGTTPSPDAVYQLRDCVSPRVINLIVIDNFANDPPRIVAFAAFYILGCKTDSQPLSVLPNGCDSGPPGQLQLWGIFFNKVELGGDIGEFNPFGTHKIALVE